VAGEAECLKLERDDFFDARYVIADASFHRWRHELPLISIIFSRVFLLATCGLVLVLANHDSTIA
jgi:hypothetical protein